MLRKTHEEKQSTCKLLERNKVMRNSQHELVENISRQTSLSSFFDKITGLATRIQQ